MNNFTNMSIEELNAMMAQLKEAKKVVATTGDKHFKEAKENCIELIDNFVEEHKVDVPMLMRALCEHYEVKSLKKGKRKGKSTGVSRANGNRTINGYMVLLNEERRKYKLHGRKEPTTKTSHFVLTKVVAQKWQELKKAGIENKDLQINYQDWSEENPTDPTTASPIFINWWNKFNNAEYETDANFDATVDVEAWKGGGAEKVENVVEKVVEKPKPKPKRKRRTKKEMEEAKKMEAEDVNALHIGLSDDEEEETEESEETEETTDESEEESE